MFIPSESPANVIPGGSEELHLDYQARYTPGMRLYDMYHIDKVQIVARHPQQIREDSPLFLHIAMERFSQASLSKQPPLYAYYNIRTKELHLQVPNSQIFGITTELNVHLYAIVNDLIHIERSGIGIYKHNEDQQVHESNKLSLPQKRKYVISPEEIHADKSENEPLDYAYVSPRIWTLPYGSRFTLAVETLRIAQAEGDTEKIKKAQESVNVLARRLPSATSENIKKYEGKARQLSLDDTAIVIIKGKVVGAPRKESKRPIYSASTIRRDIKEIVPGYDSKALQINALFSQANGQEEPENQPATGNVSETSEKENVSAPKTASPGEVPTGPIRRFLRRMGLTKRNTEESK